MYSKVHTVSNDQVTYEVLFKHLITPRGFCLLMQNFRPFKSWLGPEFAQIGHKLFKSKLNHLILRLIKVTDHIKQRYTVSCGLLPTKVLKRK